MSQHGELPQSQPCEILRLLKSSAICLDGIDDSTIIRGLECGHVYHSACLKVSCLASVSFDAT
jgi:hypothetical protein